MEKRNIVMVTFDSLRADHCSFMGYERKTTPILDRMAKNGIYFKNAIASSISTAPSMFTMFTGDFPPLESNNYQPKDWKKEINKKDTTADFLSEKGYHTLALSPNVAFSKYFGFSKGFDSFEDFSSHPKFRSHERFQKIGRNKVIRLFMYAHDGLRKKGGATPWEDIYDSLIDKIRNLESPYFVWILLLDTHFPYLPPNKSRKWSNVIDLLYSNYLAHLGLVDKRMKLPFEIDPTKAYDDAIFYSDQFIKKLIEDTIDDNPVYIINADHGEGFGRHGRYGHPPGYPVVLYDEFIHVPLVVYNCGQEGVIKKPFSLKDMPELLDRVSKTRNFSLKELSGEFSITKVKDRGKHKFSLRSSKWKLILEQNRAQDIISLYNLREDPQEKKDLADKRPKLAEGLGNILKIRLKKREKDRIKSKIH